MKQTIRLTESELRNMITESVKRALNEGKNDFEAAKYQGKWSIFDNGSRTYSHIGVGKKKAIAKAKELNDYCTQKDKEENEKKTSESINRKIDKIVSESVRRILNEEIEENKISNFFNNFRRTNPVSKAYPNNNYIYKNGEYFYYDEQGNEHPTGIRYENGRVGTNWNPLKSTQANQVSDNDLKNAKQQLRNWDNKNADRIRRHNTTMGNINRRFAEQDRAQAEEDNRRWEAEKKFNNSLKSNKESYTDPIANYMGSNPLSR